MADFEVAFTRREPTEGGWSGEPQDSGNWTGGEDGRCVGQCVGTNRGVTAWEYAKYIGHTPSIQDMKDMPREAAMEIFKKNYWDIMRGDEIGNQGIANDLYDTCVNEGEVTGIRQLQQAAGIPTTGRMDDFTLSNINNTAS